MNKREFGAWLLAIGMLLLIVVSTRAETSEWTLLQSGDVPKTGTFYLLSLEHHGIPGPPLPASFCTNCDVYSHGDGTYAVNDAGLTDPSQSLSNLSSFLQTMSVDRAMSAEATLMSQESSGSEESSAFGPDDLWIEVLSVNLAFRTIDLRLHNTVEYDIYQILSKTNLVDRGDWILKDWNIGTPFTNATDFTGVSIGNNNQMFFKAHHADSLVSIQPVQDAIEPDSTNGYPGQIGLFYLFGGSSTKDVPVYFNITGSAQNGVDYTNMPTVVTIPAGSGGVYISIQPIEDNMIEFEESVTFTILQTNTYAIRPSYESATITISDPTNYFVAVVTNLDSPIGIDYHAPSNSLVVSYNYGNGGDPYGFALIHEDGTLTTNWSGVSGLYDEVKIVTVKTGGALTNAAGFTNGVMYFGNDTQIGWLSADGTHSNLNWGILTNDVVLNALPLRGSLGMDQTGVWSNNLIAVASDGANTLSDKGIWRIDVNQHPHLITNIFTRHLEGVVALTNVVAKWGPWAGKIITGDEDARDENQNPRPLIYTVATNGEVASYAFGIHPEDFDIVRANQDLYCVDYQGASSTILKLSRNYLTNFIDDIVVTQAGEPPAPGAKLFFVHWDSTNFVVRSLSLPDKYAGRFEHVTFAPISLPPVY